MGYDLHIHRGRDGWWEATESIGSSEWRSFVVRAGDFDLVGGATAETPNGEILRYENADLAVWMGHPGARQVAFDFRDGRLVVKNPDPPTIARMLEVADALNARVQGDDGEWYPLSDSPSLKRRWWNR